MFKIPLNASPYSLICNVVSSESYVELTVIVNFYPSTLSGIDGNITYNLRG